MKGNFRNRIMTAASAAALSILLLSGFDSSLTVEDITQKASASFAEQGGMNCEVRGTADAAIDFSAGEEAQSLPFSGSVDWSVQMTMDPFVMAVTGTMSGDASAMGISGSVEMEEYLIEQEDGSGIMYIRMPQGEDTGWHAASLTQDYMESTLGAVKAALSGDQEAAAGGTGIDLSALQQKITAGAELADEPVNVNGTDCYEVTQTLDGDTLFNVMSEVLNAVPQSGFDASSLETFQMVFSGIRVNMVSDYSVDDFTPVYASVDLDGSDLSAIGQMFGAMMTSSGDSAQVPEVNVNIGSLNLNLSYGEVPDQIEIPSEALRVEPETALSMDDIKAAR